jgi:hypothetical protein
LLTKKQLKGYTFLVAKLSFPFHLGDTQPEKNPLVCSKNYDMLATLDSSTLHKLRTDPKTFFVLDGLLEGESYYYYNYFQLLTNCGIKYNIPAKKIFFLSSNLYDEDAYNLWRTTDYKINVIPFNIWDRSFIKNNNLVLYFSLSVDKTISNIKKGKHKNFLCLNRRLRPFRLMTIDLILNSSILDNTLLSHDACLGLPPRILDRADFENSWAHTMPKQLFHNTLISTVSETLGDSNNNTSLFYSEKTFKPMVYNQPVFIFGQPGINTHLEKIGYKTYSKYFDLSFDTITDSLTRLKSQIAQLEYLNSSLKTIDDQIDWYLQGRDIIEHNKQELREQTFNKKQFEKFVSLVRDYPFFESL